MLWYLPVIWVVGCIISIFITAKLSKLTPEKKERQVALISALMVSGLFVFVLYQSATPPVNEVVFKTFYVFQGVDNPPNRQQTIVYTYGQGKYIFKGIHDFKLDTYYRVEWRRQRLDFGNNNAFQNIILVSKTELPDFDN